MVKVGDYVRICPYKDGAYAQEVGKVIELDVCGFGMVAVDLSSEKELLAFAPCQLKKITKKEYFKGALRG